VATLLFKGCETMNKLLHNIWAINKAVCKHYIYTVAIKVCTQEITAAVSVDFFLLFYILVIRKKFEEEEIIFCSETCKWHSNTYSRKMLIYLKFL
jgi:hypothetical protein